MSRESKIMTAAHTNPQTLISHYEAFGWELLSLNGTQVTMSRETQNPVYPQLVEHQAAYEQKNAEYLSITMPQKPVAPPPISLKTCFWLFVLAIFPMVLYLVYKSNQKKDYAAKVDAYEREVAARNERKQTLLAEMDAIVLESRTIFFSRQN